MRRLVLTVLLLATSLLVARGAAIHPVFRGGTLAGASETGAYRVDATGVRFPLSAGARRLRVLVNLDVPPGAPPAGVTFALRVRIPEEQYDERFALVGMLRARQDGSPTAFYLGEAASPAWTREVALERRRPDAATLEVSLVEPAQASGSLRVLAEAERAPLAAEVLARRLGPVERHQLASSLGPMDWDQLPEELQADLLQRRWARLPATPGAVSRRLYIAGAPAPLSRPEAPPGDLLEAGQIAAYTVRGPGTLRLVAAGAPLRGTVELLDARGETRTAPLELEAGERLDLAVGPQVTTARVHVDGPSQVLAVVSDEALAMAGARLEARPDGEWVVHPAVRFEQVPRAEQEPSSPVRYDLRGRGARELRVTARSSVRPDDAPTTARVRWTMRDDERRVVASGTLQEALSPAPEDRLEESPGLVPTEPAQVYLWPPLSASTLELTAEPPALITVDSPAFAPPPQESGERPITVLRHAPVERPLWFRVRPSNEDELLASGRMLHLRSAARLERLEPPRPPTGVAETLETLERPPRFTLLVPGQAGATLPERGVWWPLPHGVETKVRLQSVAGASARARVPWNLLYLGDTLAPRQEVAIRVDASEVTRARLFTARGTLPLAPTTPGLHRVGMTIGQGQASVRRAPRLFLDHPTGAATPFRSVVVHPLRPGKRATVRLHKGAQPRSLGAVLYFDGAPGEQATLEVTVDAGHRTPPSARSSRTRTRLTRIIDVRAEALDGATYLNRHAPSVWGTAPLFVGLGDDLPPGAHMVSMVLRGTRARAFARFFSYGALPHSPERFSAFGEFRSAQ